MFVVAYACLNAQRLEKHVHQCTYACKQKLSSMSARHCSTPTALSVTYNLKDVGMDYDRSLFGMKLSDCRNLAKALESTETLTYLNLSNNSLDDDKVGMAFTVQPGSLPAKKLEMKGHELGWCCSVVCCVGMRHLLCPAAGTHALLVLSHACSWGTCSRTAITPLFP